MTRYRGRPSKYRKGLKNNPYWQKVRSNIKVRDFHCCAICKAKIKLEVHHITYYVNGKSILGYELEHLKWLITLCSDCHSKVHKDESHLLNPKNPKKVHANNYCTS